MMGRQTGDQASLFYEFRLEDRISKDHLLRRINVFVAPVLDSVREQLKPYYSEIGRPSVDPELMIRMLIVGYCYGLRTRLSRRTGSTGSARATCFAAYSNASSAPVCENGSMAAGIKSLRLPS